MHYTYLHLTKDTNKIFYIGKGSGNRAFSENRRNKYWKNIVAKHGFTSEILANWNTEKEALNHEKVLIACFKDMGYQLANLTDGGEGISGFKHSERTKKIVSQTHSGKKISSDHIEKIKISSTGRKHTKETKEYLKKINTGENNPMYGIGCMKGKKHTEETKRKLSEKKMGWKMSDEHKKIISFTHKGKKQSSEQIKKRILARLATLEARKNLKEEG